MLFSLQTDGCSLFLPEDRGPDPVCFLPMSVIVDSEEENWRLLARVQHDVSSASAHS